MTQPEGENQQPDELLIEWNRIARENTENAIVSSMFDALLGTSPSIDAFSTWLLVGAAAIASFLIINADQLVHVIGHSGLVVCGILLTLSGVCGLISRIFALYCRTQITTNVAIKSTFLSHMRQYEEEEKKIGEAAGNLGITIETGIRFDRVLSEFFAPFPRWVAWIANRYIAKYKNNPQVGRMPVIRSLKRQGLFSFIQTLLFISFLCAGFAYVVI